MTSMIRSNAIVVDLWYRCWDSSPNHRTPFSCFEKHICILPGSSQPRLHFTCVRISFSNMPKVHKYRIDLCRTGVLKHEDVDVLPQLPRQAEKLLGCLLRLFLNLRLRCCSGDYLAIQCPVLGPVRGMMVIVPISALFSGKQTRILLAWVQKFSRIVPSECDSTTLKYRYSNTCPSMMIGFRGDRSDR